MCLNCGINSFSNSTLFLNGHLFIVVSVCCNECNILIRIRNLSIIAFNLLRKFCKGALLFHSFLNVVSMKNPIFIKVIHKLYAAFDKRITDSKRFNLGVIQHSFIHVLTLSNSNMPGKDLADKSLFGFKQLPRISIKASLRDITVNFYVLTFISLSKDSSLSLHHIGRSPRHVKMMESCKSFLNIHTESHLKGRTDYNRDKSVLQIAEQKFLFSLTISIVNIGDLIFRHTHRLQQIFQLIVKVKAVLRCGAIAEDHLNQFLITSSLVNIHDILCTTINLRVRIETKCKINQSHIECCLTSICRNFKKVVLGFMHSLISNVIGSCRDIPKKLFEIIAANSYGISISIKRRNSDVLVNMIKISD